MTDKENNFVKDIYVLTKAELVEQLISKMQECEEYEQALDEIAAHYQKVIKNITNYDDSYDASISIKALHNISDIINKVKGDK